MIILFNNEVRGHCDAFALEDDACYALALEDDACYALVLEDDVEDDSFAEDDVVRAFSYIINYVNLF